MVICLSCVVHSVFAAVLQYHTEFFDVGVIIATNIHFVCFHSLSLCVGFLCSYSGLLHVRTRKIKHWTHWTCIYIYITKC